MLVKEDDANHQEVAPNTNNEYSSIEAEEDNLHPVLVNVELLVAAHLLILNVSELPILIDFLVVAIIRQK